MEGPSSSAPAAKRLEGKVALITGGASGIGESTGRLFARHGAKIVIADVQSELGQNVSAQIQSESGQPVSYVRCDVTNETDVENAVNTAIALHGKLDIMFNNAGTSDKVGAGIGIATVVREAFRRVIDVNVYGGLLAAKHASRVMIPQTKGCILFTACCASLINGGPYAYTAFLVYKKKKRIESKFSGLPSIYIMHILIQFSPRKKQKKKRIESKFKV